MSRNAYITEAFKQFNILLEEDQELEAEEMPIYDVNSEKMHDFLDTAGEDVEDVNIFDLEAEAEEDLKQSYVGKVILDCNVCHSNIFIDKDEIIVDEDGVANIELECPYCMSNEGYTIIGKVEPYSETEEDVESDEEETDNEPIDEPIEVEDEEETEVVEEGFKKKSNKRKLSESKNRRRSKFMEAVDEEDGPEFDDSIEEWIAGRLIDSTGSSSVHLYKKSDGWYSHKYGKRNILGPFDSRDEALNALLAEYPNDKHENFPKYDDEKDIVFIQTWPKHVEEGLITKEERNKILADAGEYLAKGGMKDPEFFDILNDTDKKLQEDIQDVTITTDDETMTMTTKEDGGISVETTPTDEVDEVIEEPVIDETTEEENTEEPEIAPDDEVIAPLEDEEENDIELGSEVEQLSDEEIEKLDEPDETEDELEISDFDEDSFDELGESYLRRHYDNVNGFKTVNVKVFNDNLIVEGVIRFDSGASKVTSFIFEATKSKKNGVLFEGYNRQISRGKKTFKMACSIKEGMIRPVKLNYNYVTKNELNESVRVNGTCKIK